MKKGAAATVGGLTLLLLLLIPVEEPNVQTRGLAIYSDQKHTQPLTHIDWGTLQPGESRTLKSYLTAPNATLTWTAWNWQPQIAQAQLDLSWNLTEARVVNATALWTLYAYPNITVLTFNFNINITIEE